MGNVYNHQSIKVDVTHTIDFSQKMEVNKQGELVYMTGIKKALCSFWLGRKIINAIYSKTSLETVGQKIIELCKAHIIKISNEDKPNLSKTTFDQRNSNDSIEEFKGISANISSLLNKWVKKDKDIYSTTYKACVEIQESIQKPLNELITAKDSFLKVLKNKEFQESDNKDSKGFKVFFGISHDEFTHNAHHVMSLITGTDEAPTKGSYVIKYDDNCEHCAAHKKAKS